MSIKLIKALLNREFYDKYRHKLSKDFFAFDNNVKNLYQTLEKAYETIEADLTVNSLKELHYTYNPTITSANKRVLEELFTNLSGLDITKEVSEVILKKAIEQNLWTEIANIGIQGGDGLTTDFIRAQEILDNIREGITLHNDIKVVEGSIDEMLEATSKQMEWKFHIPTLQRRIDGIGKSTFTLIAARPNVGKCLGYDTPILMYNGTVKPVQNINIGDKLMAPDSTSRTVLTLARGKEQLYRIKYSWGDSYIVNENHILSLKRSKKEGRHKYGSILNVTVKEYLSWPEGRKQRYKGWKTGIKFKEKSYGFSLPPRILGIWLGDGHSSGTCITNTDSVIIKELEEYSAIQGLTFKQTSWEDITYSISNARKGNSFLQALKLYNLINNKHIPKDYLLGTTTERLQLLSGLLDTDGYYSKNSYEITQKNKNLAEDILFLARSLGLHSTIKKVYKTATNGKLGNKGEYYSVRISGNINLIPCKIKYKIASKTNSKRKNLHFGFSVEKLNIDEYYGFTLDKDGLFVLGDFTVTHNTGLTTSFIAQPGGFLDQGAHVTYIGNEEAAVRTRLRMASCYSGFKRGDFIDKDKREQAQAAFDKVRSNLTVLDMAGYSVEELQKYLKDKRTPIDILVVDVLDKLSIQGSYGNESEKLYRLYTVFRELLKKHDIAGIGTSQASADAENRAVFGMDCLANSKTGKGGELDVCFCLGRHLEGDQKDEGFRTLNIPKNKLTGVEDYVTFVVDFNTNRVRA